MDFNSDSVPASGAVFSANKIYRYMLWRLWKEGRGMCVFIGLNPSTADETYDDPTIRRCVDFAKRWGYRGLVMLNAFAYRATDRSELREVNDPVGPGNNLSITDHVRTADIVIAAWGIEGGFLGRDKVVLTLVKNLRCMGRTQAGFPRHPLYLRKDTKLEAYTGRS